MLTTVDRAFGAALWLSIGLLALILLAGAPSGCASAPPPKIEGGAIGGTLTLRTPTGPVVVDLDAQTVVSGGEGWGVEAYEAHASAVVTYGGIAHTVAIEAQGRCVVVAYVGALALSYEIPGTGCPTQAPLE